MIKALINSDLSYMTMEELIDYFREVSLEDYEKMSINEIEKIYTEYVNNALIS